MLAAGRRQHLVEQASLVWSDRGPEAIAQYVRTGIFSPRDKVEPYNQHVVKAIVESGRLG